MNKKDLKNAYKNYKPDMGVFLFRCKANETAYLGYGQNIKADINRITFQLKHGSFFSNTKSNLQDDWNKYGETNFEISTLELLEYSKDESKTDYQADLQILREFCSEKFSKFEYIFK